ncbi:MAG: outer membrane beta-barrel protein [Legionella sp.]|nr:outer membrane beta-barrel protein [Legionella sp.]
MNKPSIIITLLALSKVLQAGTMGPAVTPDAWRPVLTLSAGPAWSNNNGKTQTVFLQSDIEKTYAAKKRSSTLGTGELFLGVQKLVHERVLGQLGVAVAAASNIKLAGDIWEDADPEFNNFTYAYNVNQLRVAAKGKLLANWEHSVAPYISGSLGVGFTNAHNFSITPKIFEEIPAPGFRRHNNTTFSYTVGAGLQKSINNNLQAGIGYEFADWGKSHLRRAPGQTLNSGLHLSSIYTHELQFSLSYIV